MSPRRRNTVTISTPVAILLLIIVVCGLAILYLPMPAVIAQFRAPIADVFSPIIQQLGLPPPQIEQTPAQVSVPASAPPQQPASGAIPATAPGGLPNMPQKPAPQQITFKGCPPEGDGGDPQLNRMKNRIDEGNYLPVSFDIVVKLPWPSAIERKDRVKWSPADAANIAQWEGIPIAVEGYIFDAKEEGPESPNCHGAESEHHDFHVWLTKTAGEDRVMSIVFEPTPRVRANHPTWTTKALDNFAKNKTRVRISGWLMMDQEHPDQVGKTRGTIWEIHPVLKIEFQQGTTWTPL